MIKIKPKKLSGSVTAVSSKSYAHRLIIAAMLSEDKTEIEINGISDDIKRTLECVRSLGGAYFTNGNLICIYPIERGRRAEVFCGESGTTARIMLPVCAAVCSSAVISGSGRLPERPFGEIVNSLRRGGVIVDGEKLPIKVCGGMKSGIYEIEGDVSSQYITGLMYALGAVGGGEIVLTTPLKSASYVDLTVNVLNQFGVKAEKTDSGFKISGSFKTPGKCVCEGDWSNAAFWFGANALGSNISVKGLNINSRQGDRKITELLGRDKIDIDSVPDLFPILAACATGKCGETLLYNAARLRLKESDRIDAASALIKALGGECEAGADYLKIIGHGSLSGGTVDSFGDHRIVMAAAAASVICENDVIINGEEAVNKSYPDFFRDFRSLGGEADVI